MTATLDTSLLSTTAQAVQSAGTQTQAVDPSRLERAKFAYTTREAARLAEQGEQFSLLTGTDQTPASGDLVLARVTSVGKHKKIETPSSRRSTLFVGDEVVLAYGNRYAADQYHAIVPPDLGHCHMVAAGGVAGLVLDQHASITEATAIEPLGLLARGDRALNLADLAGESMDPAGTDVITPRPHVVAVFGTSMNSGKTTTAAWLAHGLAAAGYEVGAGKVTGTGAGNDPWFFQDAGASHVLDFTDFGYPTTFQVEYPEIRSLLTSQIRVLAERGADVIILEIADGLYQAETRRLLADPIFAHSVDQVMFAATDALGAAAGTDFLSRSKVEVATVSGLLTASPLATSEARAALNVPVTETYDLGRAEVAQALVRGELELAPVDEALRTEIQG